MRTLRPRMRRASFRQAGQLRRAAGQDDALADHARIARLVDPVAQHLQGLFHTGRDYTVEQAARDLRRTLSSSSPIAGTWITSRSSAWRRKRRALHHLQPFGVFQPAGKPRAISIVT
jgi:hypothetical protein